MKVYKDTWRTRCSRNVLYLYAFDNLGLGNLLLTSSAVVNLSLPTVRTYLSKIYALRDIKTAVDFFLRQIPRL